MEIENFVQQKKELYSTLMDFINELDDYKDTFNSLIQVCEKQDIFRNQDETLNLICLISKIDENYHRTPYFYQKFEIIFNYIINEKKFSISSSELFRIFKNSKRMLLLLLEKKFIIPDNLILKQIFEMKDQNNYDYSAYLYLGIKPYLNEAQQKKIEKYISTKYDGNLELFFKMCQIGENHSYICSLIRNDSIEEFITYINQTNYPLSSKITKSIFETNSFLIGKKPNLIEYAAFFGSIQIIQYLNLNNAKLRNRLFYYSIHSNNPDVIHFCEENKVLSDDDYDDDFSFIGRRGRREYPMNLYIITNKDKNKDYLNYLEEAVKCHHNDIYSYIKNNFFTRKFEENHINTFESYIINYYNYNFYPDNITDMISKTKNYNGFNIHFLCSSLTKITIPSSVTLIGNSAFYGCSSLKEVVISSSVKRIGNDSFGECISLEEVIIPSSVTKIGQDCFKGCIKLIKISIPTSVTSIGSNCFENCSSLIEMDIPSSVKSISNSVFYGCSSLQRVNISPSVTSIGDFCFALCKSLREVVIPSSIKLIGKHAFEGCLLLEEINIPDNVNSIKEYTFNGCISLKKVSIPASVYEIGDFCFYGCKNLEKNSINLSDVYFGEHVFQ